MFVYLYTVIRKRKRLNTCIFRLMRFDDFISNLKFSGKEFELCVSGVVVAVCAATHPCMEFV